MPRLTVDPAGTHLVQDGGFLPLIIDTAWSSFADPTEDEWRTYLSTRRRQGFTAVLVSVLPILHDRDVRPGAREPFALDPAGRHDFTRPDDGYYATAREFTRIAHDEYGLRLMITVLWNNYLPGTWGAEITPQAVMPAGCRLDHVARVARTFADLHPIFVVGGDDHYTVPAANEGYLQALRHLREAAPDCLLTTHSAPNAVLPDDIADRLDLHLHQSGHNLENQELTWRQPPAYLSRPVRRPLINSEPPYEQHGIVGGHGRWSRADVRRASWTSVLAGAAAGIGYGAHGMWMWHSPGGDFQATRLSLEPYHWPEALAFPGALDVSLMARLFVDHRLYRLEPAQDLLVDDCGGQVRLAADPAHDLVVLYQPYARDVELRVDLRGYRIVAWDLAERAPLTVDPLTVDAGAGTRLRQLASPGDQLVVAERV